MISTELAEKHGLNRLSLRVTRTGKKLAADFTPYEPFIDGLIDKGYALQLARMCLPAAIDEAQITVSGSGTNTTGFYTQLPSYVELERCLLLAFTEQCRFINQLRVTFDEVYYRSCARGYAEAIACAEIQANQIALICPLYLGDLTTFIDPMAGATAVFGEEGYLMPGAPQMFPPALRADIDEQIWRNFRHFAAEELIRISQAITAALDGVEALRHDLAKEDGSKVETAKNGRPMGHQPSLN